MDILTKTRAPRNRTISLTPGEVPELRRSILSANDIRSGVPVDATIHGDSFFVLPQLSLGTVDLLILDPPYNLNKQFSSTKFLKQSVNEYTDYLRKILSACAPLLKPTASIYVCGDWHSSVSIFEAVSEFFVARNRITWEREKGRGATTNWKNSSEDIWFCTVSNNYHFNVDAVKLRRKVIAPYRSSDGAPKDWIETDAGGFRDTHPSNMWTDITIPFWSMPENTDHPTQKSEKLIAKLILASTKPGDLILDPFLGSGTTSVAAKKLGRHFIGIEAEEEYALLAAKRLAIAEQELEIQGYADGIFWERNSLNHQMSAKKVDRRNRSHVQERLEQFLPGINID